MEIKRHDTQKRMSRAVIHNGTVYLCGQVAKDASHDMAGQTRTTLERVEELLEEVGTNKDKILSVTIYVKEMSMFAEMNEVWDNWVNEGYAPARACVEAKLARPELLFEISVIAAL